MHFLAKKENCFVKTFQELYFMRETDIDTQKADCFVPACTLGLVGACGAY